MEKNKEPTQVMVTTTTVYGKESLAESKENPSMKSKVNGKILLAGG